MAVLRQANLLGDQRVDVPHLRALESAVAADFDVVAGRVQAGGKALVIRGFELSNYTAGTASSNVQLNTADSVLYNQNATEAGTFLWVPLDRPVEVLDSALNSRVDGSFVAGTVNYIGVDLVRQTDVTTTDHVKFLDANTLLEQGYEVPLARTLDYRITITSTPFSALPHLTPIAKVTTDANNLVVTVEDARNIMWRLGSGGDFPNSANGFAWPQDRVESAGAFTGGDKGILSQKDWQDAIMSRVWEIGGGENWYSPTADRNFKLVGSPTALFISTGDNFEWQTGLYGVSHLHWQGLQFLFENSNTPGIYFNTIVDQLVDDPAGSAAASKTALAPGECLYVDLDRTTNATLTAHKATMQNLGEPAVPGSRVIIVWRNADGWFRRDGNFAAHTLPPTSAATVIDIGTVRLAYAAGAPLTPTVAPLNADNAVRVGEGSYPVAPGAVGVYSFSGSGFGVHGHSTTLAGGYFTSVNGIGAEGFGPIAGLQGTSTNVPVGYVATNAGAIGVSRTYTGVRGVSTNSYGIEGLSSAYWAGHFEGANGVTVTGTSGVGVEAVGSAGEPGVRGTGNFGVFGIGTAWTGLGLLGAGVTGASDTVTGVRGVSGSGVGGEFISTTGYGAQLTGNATKAALRLVPAGEPSSVDEGQLYYSSAAHSLYFRNTSGWVNLTASGVPDASSTVAGVVNLSNQTLGAGIKTVAGLISAVAGGPVTGTAIVGEGTNYGVWGEGGLNGVYGKTITASGAGVLGVFSSDVGMTAQNAGVQGWGGSTAYGGHFSGTSERAINCQGHIAMSGSNTGTSTAVLNQVKPDNLVKAYGTVHISDAGAVTVTDAFNCSPVSPIGGSGLFVYVQLGSPMANDDAVVMCQWTDRGWYSGGYVAPYHLGGEVAIGTSHGQLAFHQTELSLGNKSVWNDGKIRSFKFMVVGRQ